MTHHSYDPWHRSVRPRLVWLCVCLLEATGTRVQMHASQEAAERWFRPALPMAWPLVTSGCWNKGYEGLPWRPVVQTLHFCCRGCGFNPWLRKIPHGPQPKKSKRKGGYMYLYIWITLLYTRNYHIIVNQLHSHIKYKLNLKNKIKDIYCTTWGV